MTKYYFDAFRARAFMWLRSPIRASLLNPVFFPRVINANEYEKFCISTYLSGRNDYRNLGDQETLVLDQIATKMGSRFAIRGVCPICKKPTLFLVGAGGATRLFRAQSFKWREELFCETCQMNSRSRAAMKEVLDNLRPGMSIYASESLGRFIQILRRKIGSDVELSCSEYLGNYTSGKRAFGIIHQNALQLSYPDNSYDMYLSRDVMEHVNDPDALLREAYRIIKPNGFLIMTVPVEDNLDVSFKRAELVGSTVSHLQPPEYHGDGLNPLSGTLVFWTFGWDLLDIVRRLGFREVFFLDRFEIKSGFAQSWVLVARK